MREEIKAHCRISTQQEIENPQQLVHGMRYRNIRGPSRRHSMHNRHALAEISTSAKPCVINPRSRRGRSTNAGPTSGEQVFPDRFGTLRIRFTENASWWGVVPESFRRLRSLQPDVVLQLKPSSSLEQLEAIQSGRLDAGFVFNMPEADPELSLRPVAVQHIELAAPSGHALTGLRKIRLRDLSDANFVWFPRRESPALYDRLMRECFRGGPKATILSLVATGLGV
jgi:hypothetical protein